MPTTTHQRGRTEDLVIGLDEVAKVLRKSPDTIKRRWLEFHEKLGMPRKHAAGWFWPRRSFEVWLTSQAAVAAAPGNDNTGDIPPEVHTTRVSEQRAALHQQLGVSS